MTQPRVTELCLLLQPIITTVEERSEPGDGGGSIFCRAVRTLNPVSNITQRDCLITVIRERGRSLCRVRRRDCTQEMDSLGVRSLRKGSCPALPAPGSGLRLGSLREGRSSFPLFLLPSHSQLSKITERLLLAAFQEKGRCWVIREVSLGGQEVTASPQEGGMVLITSRAQGVQLDEPSSLAQAVESWHTALLAPQRHGQGGVVGHPQSPSGEHLPPISSL